MSVQEMAEAYSAAWSSGDPEAVVSFYRDDGSITINRGDPIEGRQALLDMVAGFYAEFPGLTVSLDHLRMAGDHVIFGWVLEGKHAETGNRVRVPGWEEWDLDENLKVRKSLGWFDAVEYERQIEEGI
ncbi:MULTISPECIES: nuclear transport factor 2 family protein [unclassified Roseovarius]|uniref:nuclear transport factor 2 family protein n=1 Tax=unclassified Roseovarius TaxID=2614913 RepID=UPI00273E65AB|nr:MULTISPECIES: nuclear transport factor 2 family protein [unclassified Roseovarius]